MSKKSALESKYPYPTFKDHYFRDVYAATNSRMAVAATITFNSIHVFKKAITITRADELKSIIAEPLGQGRKEKMAEFMFERIVDDLRFIVCFENFIKSTLITQKYLVHQVKDEQLKSQQRKRPILIEEVLTQEAFLLENKNDFPLTEKTIQFSDLLTRGYREASGLPVPIYNLLRKINQRRNENHFLFFMELTPKEVLEEAATLNKFVDEQMVPWVQKLDSELKKGQAHINRLTS